MILKFYKVVTLPWTLTANSVYFVQNGSYAETYITDASWVAKMVWNTSMINTLIATALNTALADYNMIQIVTDITARNTLASWAWRNLLILVTDATWDTSVSSWSALYAYNETGAVFTKLSEYESLEAAISWATLTWKPTSSVSDIDDAVSKKHSHTNKTQLDKIGEDGNWNMTYNGNNIDPVWWTNNW